MAKLLIQRGANQNRIPANITNQEASKLVERAGFVLLRSGTHRIYRHPSGQQLTLPSSGTLSPWLTQLVYRAYYKFSNEESEDAEEAKRLPLTVAHNGKTYAVVGQSTVNYQLMSLFNGNKSWVPMKECIEVQPEGPVPSITVLTPASQDLDEVRMEEPEMTTPEPTVPTAVAATPPIEIGAPPPVTLSNPSDQEAWIRLTRRYIDTLDTEKEKLKIQIQQLEGRIAGVTQQQEVLSNMLAVVTGHAPAATPEHPPIFRRTVLPPTGPGTKRRGPNRKPRVPVTPQVVERIISMTRGGEKQNEIAAAIGVSNTSVSRTIAKARKDGRLPRKD